MHYGSQVTVPFVKSNVLTKIFNWLRGEGARLKGLLLHAKLCSNLSFVFAFPGLF